jgi:hypothetical protein
MTQARERGGVVLAQVVDPNHISYSYKFSEQDSEHWLATGKKVFSKMSTKAGYQEIFAEFIEGAKQSPAQ